MNSELKSKIVSCQKCSDFGINFVDTRKENLEYAYKYKPEKVKLLWIVESPPLSYPPRYFYRPELTQYDGLFRETMKALGIPVTNPKSFALEAFKDLGYFLIDSSKCPADKSNSHFKPKMMYNCSDILSEEIIDLNPEHIVIIKADVFQPVIKIIRNLDLKYPELNISKRIKNQNSIPFPGSGQQVRFREAIKGILDTTEY